MKNNFDFLRLLFAIFVVVTHSYELSGSQEKELGRWLTNDQTSLSYIGVRGFFIISGFLIFQSLMRSTSLLDYYKKRFSRIFPALFVVLVLTVVLGVFVYEGNFISYSKNKSVWMYVPNNLSLFRLQYSIKGIFEQNPYPSAINGSLWTIPYEFIFYVFISFLFFLKKGWKRIGTIIFFGLLFAGRFFFYEELSPHGFFNIWSRYVLDVGLYFFTGALLASVEFDKSNNLKVIFITSLLLLVLSVTVNAFEKTQYLFLPLIVISFGLLSTKYISTMRESFGDVSYGIYIYSFPIQQTLIYYFAFSYLQLMIYSVLLSMAAGYFSWHYVERKSLHYASTSFVNLNRNC